VSRERLIVALDHPNARAALEEVDALGDAVERYKVGLELFIAEGRALVDELHDRDKRVFLDLKLHDIPETVRRAAEVASKLGVELLTVHAGGGRKMLEAAVAGAGATQVLAVTVAIWPPTASAAASRKRSRGARAWPRRPAAPA
jgi:orotidine-5'-phosphate decarboxylase